MASTARAYEQDSWAAIPRVSQPRHPFEVLPGAGRRAKSEPGVNPLTLFAFKVGIAVLVLLGIVGIAAVWLQASTVSLLSSTSEVKSQITEARSDGSALEVQYSVLDNPTRIKSIASEQLGMAAAENVGTIDLSGRLSASSSDAASTTSSGADVQGEGASSDIASTSVAFAEAVGSACVSEDPDAS